MNNFVIYIEHFLIYNVLFKIYKLHFFVYDVIFLTIYDTHTMYGACYLSFLLPYEKENEAQYKTCTRAT